MKYTAFAVILFITAFLTSCRTNEKRAVAYTGTASPADSGYGIRVADRIIQDIIIKNNDPDNVWAEESLRGMDQKSLVDTIFSMVYSQRAAAYDFDTNEKLTARQVRQLEKKEGFSRDKIGKIQFTESWYLDPVGVSMTKRVSVMVLGYECYDNQGNFTGYYLPIFRVGLN